MQVYISVSLKKTQPVTGYKVGTDRACRHWTWGVISPETLVPLQTGNSMYVLSCLEMELGGLGSTFDWLGHEGKPCNELRMICETLPYLVRLLWLSFMTAVRVLCIPQIQLQMGEIFRHLQLCQWNTEKSTGIVFLPYNPIHWSENAIILTKFTHWNRKVISTG